MCTRKKLAETARQKVLPPIHGTLPGQEANIHPIVSLFPNWSVRDAERMWCAAFMHYCCVEAGFKLPYSPDECVICSLAGCGGWDEAEGNGNNDDMSAIMRRGRDKRVRAYIRISNGFSY